MLQDVVPHATCIILRLVGKLMTNSYSVMFYRWANTSYPGLWKTLHHRPVVIQWNGGFLCDRDNGGLFEAGSAHNWVICWRYVWRSRGASWSAHDTVWDRCFPDLLISAISHSLHRFLGKLGCLGLMAFTRHMMRAVFGLGRVWGVNDSLVTV